MRSDKIIIIGWQPLSRRAQTFARHIHAPFYLIHFFKFKCPLMAPIKYIFQAIKTLWVLCRERPAFLIVENPPVFLPLIGFIYARVFGSHLIIDSATGAFLDPKWKRFFFLFRFLARRALLNIVTNEGLKNILKKWKAQAFVLEDCIPHIPVTQSMELKKGFNVVVINTFSFDEPIEETLLAAVHLPDVNFYITGDTRYAKRHLLKSAPSNVTFTGYLAEPEPYFSLLWAADVIMVLCKIDFTLCAGMYEAVSLTKPLIASDWEVVRRFFNKGAVYTRNTPEDITNGVIYAMDKKTALKKEMMILRNEARYNWEQKSSSLLNVIKERQYSND